MGGFHAGADHEAARHGAYRLFQREAEAAAAVRARLERVVDLRQARLGAVADPKESAAKMVGLPDIQASLAANSTFSKNRHGRFRESDLLRKLFETVVARCMKEGIVGGEAFAVDASIIVADAHRRRGGAKVEDLDPTSSRAVAEYLSVLDDAAFGGATPVEPKVISPTDPAARYTAAADKPAVYAYSDNHLIDLKHAVIIDVEATTAIRQAEVGAAKTMLDRTAEQFDLTPRLVADAGYGSAGMVGWLVDERGIEPHVKLIDKSERTDGTFSREPTSSSIQRATAMFALAAKN